MEIKTVAIVGVGLLGGSLGAALQARRIARKVVGIGRRDASLRVAMQRGLIHEATTDPAAGVAEADLVVMCTPVGRFATLLEAIAPALRAGAVVTDVGSTKARVVEDARRILPNPRRFVGSHPIAGSERRGPEHADANLFEGGLCLITPAETTDPAAIEMVRRLWTAVGMRVRTIGPREHDAVLARTSHLPHLAAAAMVDLLSAEQEQFVGPGFLDTTRIAAGDVEMWADICEANAPAIAEALDQMIVRLTEVSNGLKQGQPQGVKQLLERAQTRRKAMNRPS